MWRSMCFLLIFGLELFSTETAETSSIVLKCFKAKWDHDHKPFLIVGVFRLKKPNRLFNPSIILDWSCCCLCLVKSDLTPSLRDDDNDECWISRPRSRGCWLEAAADGWSRPRLRQMEAAARPREARLQSPATHKIILSQNKTLLQDTAPTVLRFL